MLRILWFLGVAGCCTLWADHGQWIAHLSANDTFKSEIVLRNDSFDDSLTVTVWFYASDGSDAVVNLTDANGAQNAVSQWQGTLAPQTATAISLTAVNGGDNRSVQALVAASETGSGDDSTLLAIEASFTRFEGDTAVSQVGVALSDPATLVKVNVPADQLRGFGITNTSADTTCECTFTLLGADGSQVGTSVASIPTRGKWLGVVSDLFPGFETGIGGNLGQISALCSTKVAVQALAFNGAVMSGVPSTGFNFDP